MLMRTLWFGLALTHLVGAGGAVKLLCHLGDQVSLACPYRYEDSGAVSQLAVQWRSPDNQLLCHFIKHKGFTNCSAGYTLTYRPGDIHLSISSVSTRDLGTHVCSVSKRHQFNDYRVELDTRTDTVTSAPNSGWKHSGSCWTLILQALMCLFAGGR